MEAESSLQVFLEALPVAAYFCEAPSGDILFYNRRAAELWGREPAREDRFSGAYRLIGPDGTVARSADMPVARALASGEPVQREDVIIERPDGSNIRTMVDVALLRNNVGQTSGAIVILNDITERGESEEATEEAQALLAAIVRSSDDAIVTKTLDGIITSWNKSAENLFEYSAEEAIGKPITIIIPVERYDEENMILTRLRRGERIEHFETVRVTKEGRLLDISLTVSPVRDSNGKIIGASKIARDITEKKSAQEQLRMLKEELEKRVAERTSQLAESMNHRARLQHQLLHAQRVESMGTLAGGIAHDFNNILNIIRGYASHLCNCGPISDQAKDCLDTIHQTIERGAALVQQLLTLARKKETKAELTDIVAIVRNLIPLLQQTFPKTIAIQFEADENIPLILVDHTQIEQALLNLCINARDAMPKGGMLKLRLRVADPESLRFKRRNPAFGETKSTRYVCIEVVDNGVGMDDAIISRLFEPFFTTKASGRGTGLGLAVAYGIVTTHDGWIDVESQPMSGATFRIYLPSPATTTSPGHRFEQAAAKENSADCCGTILVVEDEMNMLRLLELILVQRGFQVLKASNGDEALAIFRRNHKEIDAVLLDLGLPKLSGEEVLLQMKDYGSALKVVVASGYLEPELKARLQVAGVKDFVNKPYVIDELVTTLQKTDRKN